MPSARPAEVAGRRRAVRTPLELAPRSVASAQPEHRAPRVAVVGRRVPARGRARAGRPRARDRGPARLSRSRGDHPDGVCARRPGHLAAVVEHDRDVGRRGAPGCRRRPPCAAPGGSAGRRRAPRPSSGRRSGPSARRRSRAWSRDQRPAGRQAAEQQQQDAEAEAVAHDDAGRAARPPPGSWVGARARDRPTGPGSPRRASRGMPCSRRRRAPATGARPRAPR